MEEPTSPDEPSSPAEPAEEIPAWVQDQAPEGALAPSGDTTETGQPAAETLAERHRARRQNFRRLTGETTAPAEQPAAAELAADAGQWPSDLETPLATPAAAEPSLLDSIIHQARQLTQGIGQGVRSLAQRLTRRERSAPAGQPEEQAAGPEPEGEPVLAAAREDPELAIRKGPRGQRMRNAWPRMRPYLWRGRIGPAFWTVASVLSLVVNIVLIVVLILLGRQLFFLKETVVTDKLVNGLYDNFVLMDQAHIRTTITVSDTIQVQDTIPVVFDLLLAQKTEVTLTKSTPIQGATIYLNGVAVPLDLDLPPGTKLGINLDLVVPVNQVVPVVLNVPVNLQVPVDIALNQTELHEPFVGLQEVLAPFRNLLADVPDAWSDVCKGAMKPVCTIMRFK